MNSCKSLTTKVYIIFVFYWIPFVREVLPYYIEQENLKNKYHISVFQIDSVVENLMTGVIGKLAKAISCFYVDVVHSCLA